jgi:hypothetical protein
VAKVTNAFDTYTASANREDLSDIIYNIDPFDTPIMTAAGRRNVSNVVYDWQTESLPAVDNTGDLEGFELSRAAGVATVRQSGVAQIKHKDATVTGTQEAGNPAGKRKEMAHQMALQSKALKRDCESVMFGTIQDEDLGNATTARATFPFMNYISTNATFQSGTGGTNPVLSTKTPLVDDSTPVALTETMLNDTLESCYTNGAEPTLLFVGAANKRVVSGFTGRSSARQNIAANKVVNSVTLYASDFGDIKVFPHRWIRSRDALLIDPRYVRVAFYRNFHRQGIGRIGDADTEMIVVEFGLQVDNEAAHGVIRDLT